MSHSQSAEKELPIDLVPVKRALLSVFDKTGLADLAKTLTQHGVDLYSTGGTERYLKEKGFTVHTVEELTGFPEVFDGRLKTLHPLVHGGLLYRRELASHVSQAEEHEISAIDMLIVNLYPFEETVAKPGATQGEIIEQIDIGGPAMLRSAAKNFRGVAIVTSPNQYAGLIDSIEKNSGATSLADRFQLASDAFALVAGYDKAISDYFAQLTIGTSAADAKLPSKLTITLPKALGLRYGENPQQNGALYGADFTQIFQHVWGKELSYNNLLDISAAAGLIAEFAHSTNAVAAVIKHTNPCGVAEGRDILEAFERAFKADPESPFGGITILNRPCTVALAERLNTFFSEVVLAPSFDADALEALKKKKDRRLVTFDMAKIIGARSSSMEIRSIIGGILMQEPDIALYANTKLESVTSRKLTTEEIGGLEFAWKVCKHVKSNAIVYAVIEDGLPVTAGIGCGQTSRVESSRLAVERAKQFGHSLRNSLVASDAFFPFADGLLEAIHAGAIAAIEPGGSVRDAEVIVAAEEHNVSLVMTGMRHFKH
jgi:phosphoribosylaminoimidazolecarboxamide formyltransferase/IMP cyclohydrolase